MSGSAEFVCETPTLNWNGAFLCWNEARDSFRGRVINARCSSGVGKRARKIVSRRTIVARKLRVGHATDKLAHYNGRVARRTQLVNHPPEPLDMAEPAINPEREDDLNPFAPPHRDFSRPPIDADAQTEAFRRASSPGRVLCQGPGDH